MYWFKDKEVVFVGIGGDEKIVKDIFTISDFEFEILSYIEYLKNKYKIKVCLYNNVSI